jgi:phosphate transport system substrate-binding protein
LTASAAALVVLLTLAACGGGDSGDSAESTGTTEVPISATLNGSGATFPKGYYEVAIEEYRGVQPDVTVNYAGGGSGTGRQNLQDGVVDFAGSDAPVKQEDVPKYKGPFLYFPTVSAPITVSYNLPDLETLRLDAETIARIFQRQIKTWNDPAIAGLNEGVKLPSTAITVAHRSDGSGTTENFTKYLVAAAPTTWTRKSGATVEWPADTQAGNGNQGVAQIVKTTTGAIGYVDFSDARASALQFADLKNQAGNFVAPTVEGATAAVAGAEVNPDLTYNPLNATGADAYPITAPTWILAYENQSDKSKGEALQSFLRYVLSDTGQELAEEVDYAPLPSSLRQQAQAQVGKIVVPA